MKTAFLVPILVFLSACATDRGGLISVRREAVGTELAISRPLPLPGSCASACTMQLLDPDVCVHPNAEIGFHAATTGGIINPAATAEVFTYYGRFPALQARLLRDRAMDKIPITWYRGQTLINYGVPQCPFTVRAKSYKGV